MTRFANKWIRIVHRWLTPAFIPILMIANMAHGTEVGGIAQAIVVPLTIIFSITGGYLWAVTLIARRRKGRRMPWTRTSAARVVPG